MPSRKNVKNTHIESRLLRQLHGALMDIVSVMNRPQRDEQMVREAGIALDRALFPLLLVSMLAACSQQAQTEETVGDPRVADVPATTASSAASQAHRQASAELDAALKAVPADAAIAEEQAEWKASLATSCETVTPEDEKLACETRLMQARVTSLQERFPK